MKLIRRRNSFRMQFLRAATIMIVFFIVIFVAIFNNFRQMLNKQYGESEKQSVEVIGNNIDYILNSVENLSNSIIFNQELMDSIKDGEKERLVEKLYSFYISSNNIEGIYVITPSGYLQVGAELQDGVKSFPRFELDQTTGEIIWFPTMEKNVKILSGSMTKRYFSMGRKIIDIYSLKELGFINIEVDESVLTGSFSDLSEDDSRIFICDDMGNIIASSDDDFTPIDSNNSSYYNTMIADDNANYVSYVEDGKKYVAIYSSFNYGKWYVVKTIPEAILYADVNRMQLYSIIGLIIPLIIMINAIVIYTKKITKPIEVMMLQMQEVEAGNLNVMVETNVYNELDDLSDSFNHMVNQIKKLMEDIVKVEQNKNELELEVLHAQINPHFLYNTLNTIRWMAKIKGEDSIADALIALVKLLRVSISFGNNMITLQEEIQYIENYILIQKLRFNQLFEIHYDIKEGHKRLNIPKLILQPIVENSLIYGIDEAEKREEPIIIEIFTREQEEYVEIVVRDNGNGIEQEILNNIFKQEANINRFSKVGLNNVNQRLKLYLGEAYGLQIVSSLNEGTTVIIRVPKNAS
ncbi:MAG: sensor histidine kinase [Clostridiales bacterium]|nr:sensor histidine kinase [Clostridiales bacterium]